MDIFQLEERKNTLSKIIFAEKSPRYILIRLCDFVNEILELKDQLLLDVFFYELAPNYIDCLKRFNVEGIPPKITYNILETSQKLLPIALFSDYKEVIADEITRISERIKLLEKSLNGKVEAHSNHQKVTFPVIERIQDQNISYGLLENIEVVIQKKSLKEKDSFDLIPSLQKIDDILYQQIKTSWLAALNYVIDKIKITHSHSIIVKLENRFGEYIGDSLGTALTISFIKELQSVYTARELIFIQKNIAFTGNISRQGNIGNLSDEIVQKKVVTAFYSSINILVIPLAHVKSANAKINELNKKFPNRVLNIVGVENLKDILNRRNLIYINIQNIFVWYIKKAYNPKLAFTLLVIVILTVSAFLFQKFDSNPDHTIVKDGKIFINNKVGDSLWTTFVGNKEYINKYPGERSKFIRIFDVDLDGENEVILCNEKSDTPINPLHHLKIICYNNNKLIRWEYLFDEKIKDRTADFENIYKPQIIDIVQDHNTKEIIVAFQQNPYYATAIIRLDFDGNKVGRTLWHAGGISSGFVKDIDHDNRLELIVAGINNGFERSAIFSIELQKLSGRSPSIGKYRFPDHNLAEFEQYILLPRTDYNRIYKKFRYNKPRYIIYSDSKKTFNCFINENLNILNPLGNSYVFDMNFNNSDIIISDNFRVERDSIVAKGILEEPFSSTLEFKAGLKKQIKYWNGEFFVNIINWDGKAINVTDSTSLF